MNRIERNKIVVDNLPLVGYLVSEVCAAASHLSRDDLASAGAIALITSAESFNPDLGVPFGAFARKRILGAFADDMRSSDWATRGARRRIKETVAVQDSLTAALGRKPSVDEMASTLGVDRDTVIAGLADAARTVTTLDGPTTEYLAADIPLPEESLLVAERLTYLRAAVAALPESMRFIVEQIYFEDRPVKDVAAELGITHSAVSQQRAEAVRLMRDGMATHYSDVPAPEVILESRISPVRRMAYLTGVSEQILRATRPAAVAVG